MRFRLFSRPSKRQIAVGAGTLVLALGLLGATYATNWTPLQVWSAQNVVVPSTADPTYDEWFPMLYTNVSGSSGGSAQNPDTVLIGHYMNMGNLQNQRHIHGFQANVTRIASQTYGESLCFGGNAISLNSGDLSQGLEVWAKDFYSSPSTLIKAPVMLKGAVIGVEKEYESNDYISWGLDVVARGETGAYCPDLGIYVRGDEGSKWKTGILVGKTSTTNSIVMANDDLLCSVDHAGTGIKPLIKCDASDNTVFASDGTFHFWSGSEGASVVIIDEEGTINAERAGIKVRRVVKSSWPSSGDLDKGDLVIAKNTSIPAYRLYFKDAGTIVYFNGTIE